MTAALAPPSPQALPCLNCGRTLPPDVDDQLTTTCSCGARYHLDLIQEALAPGARRLWLRVLACACPATDRTDPTSITVTAHMCRTLHGYVPVGARARTSAREPSGAPT